MSAFLTVENAEFEYEISRSKFIAFCRRVRSDEEATNAIAEIRKKYRDATHVCHAYIAHECARSSDDGEPSGTAGMPIMDALRGAAGEGKKEIFRNRDLIERAGLELPLAARIADALRARGLELNADVTLPEELVKALCR